MITREQLINLVAGLGSEKPPKGAPHSTELSTTKHNIFKLDPEQRVISLRKVNKFIRSFENGFEKLAFCLLIVTPEWTVIDGQHRLLAAKHLGLKVYFKIDPHALPQDSRRYGDNNDDWNLEDILHSWGVHGHPEYMALQNFIAEYPWIATSTAAMLCSTSLLAGARGREQFGDGRYVADNIEEAREIAQMALSFKTYVPFYGERRFISVLKGLHSIPGYDHKRMLKKMSYQGDKLTKQAKNDSYYRIFNDIYNYNATPDKRLYISRPTKVYINPHRRRDGKFGYEEVTLNPHQEAINSTYLLSEEEDNRLPVQEGEPA